MTKKAFKVNYETYIYLWQKARDKRYREHGKTPRPLNERELADARRRIETPKSKRSMQSHRKI